MIDHVYQTYGAEQVAMISTHATLGARSAFRDTAKTLGVPSARVDALAKRIPRELKKPYLEGLAGLAEGRGVDWRAISGTSNQSDYLSHYVANHMFFRIALPGARRILIDHIEFCNRQVPNWNPMSVVGQHMQQAGATPAEAMAFTLSSAIQYAEDCRARGMEPDAFLPRFTFFFDISVSLFEEIAKFRAGRRIWARITREQPDLLE